MKKKIVYVSSSRSDFGIVKNLLKKLEQSKDFEFYLIVIGTHILKKFGLSINEISKINFRNLIVLKCRPNLIDQPYEYIHKMSNIYHVTLKKIKPNAVILLGDRYEIAQVAYITHLLNIPILHIHGGEKTSGSKDDNYRHMISKISQLHFVAHSDFKKRLIQLGENSKNIYVVGSLALENNEKFSKNSDLLKKKYNFIIAKKKYFIITIHPCENITDTKKLITSVIQAIKNFNDYNFIFTSPNQDEGYKIIINQIEKNIYSNKNFYYHKSFGKEDFHTVLKYSLGIIGNSSSAIIEAPYYKIPSINIGNRQKGRPFSSTIYDIPISAKKLNEILKIITNIKFKLNISKIYYKKNNSSSNIVIKIIKKLNFSKLKMVKNFVDLN